MRLTYKSCMGDYGSNVDYDNSFTEIQALRNALGKYEDLGLSPENISGIVKDNEYVSGNILPEDEKDIEFVVLYFDRASLENENILKVKEEEHHIGFYSNRLGCYLSREDEDFEPEDIYRWRYIKTITNIGDEIHVDTDK